jgi:TolB protein
MRTEDRLRASLSRAAGWVAPSEEEGWQAVVEKVQRGKGPSLQRVIAALVAIAVAAAGIGIAVWTLGRNVQRPSTVLIPERIAFVKTGPGSDPGTQTMDLFTVRPDGSDQRNVTRGAAVEGPVDWSSDGSTVAFIHRSAEPVTGSDLGLRAGAFVMRADGTGLREVAACQGSHGRLPCDISDLALSPDGSQLAYRRYLSNSPGSIRSIYVIGTDGNGYREIPCTQCGLGVGSLAWSPDGTKLAFGADLAGIIGGIFGPPLSPLYIANVRTSTVKQLIDVRTNSPYPSWSPDGSRIAFAWDRPSGLHGSTAPALRHEIAVINADGSGQRTILDCDQANCSGLHAPVWSPDGTRLAFVNETQEGSEIWIVGLDGTVVRQLRPCVDGTCLDPDRAVWSPDGRRLAFQALAPNHQSWDLYVVGTDGTDLRRVAGGLGSILAWLPDVRVQHTLAPPPTKTSGNHPTSLSYPVGLIAFAGDGGTGEGDQSAIYVIGPDGMGLHRLTEGPKANEPAWSPDGTQIAFDRGEGRRGIFVMNADGSDRRRLASSRCGTQQPSWSPDGQSIVFVGLGPNCNRGAVFVMNADGGAMRQLTDPIESTSDPAWSPDGQWIAFQRQGDLYLIHPDGTGLRPLTNLPGEESKPAWAPDGTAIAFVWNRDQGDHVYLISPDGKGLRPLTDLPGSQEGPAWLPDGHGVLFVYVDGLSLTSRIEVVTIHGAVGVPITPSGWAVYDPAWQPAGG